MEDNKTNNNTQQENTPLQPIQEISTIMPTMIDDSIDDPEIKRDISSIVPGFESIEQKEGTELTSKDALLKTDGSEIIATIDTTGEAVLKANFQMPQQIDTKLRKEEQAKAKQKKKKKEKIKPSKTAKKQQNIISLGALAVIALLTCFYFFVIKAPGEEDFTPLTVTVELGDKLPIRTKDYVEPGIPGSKIDELQYIKDTSKVVLEEVGTYEFTITYKGITKTGSVVVEDTSKPNLETRDVHIMEGDTYSASSFVSSCRDFSGCNYSFQDADTINKYTSIGSHIVYIIATDAYNNSVTKKANLYIDAKGLVKTYRRKSESFDFVEGYKIEEVYELYFSEFSDNAVLINGKEIITLEYENDDLYQKARKEYSGEANYQCLDHEKKIVSTKTVKTVGSNYSKYLEIKNYFLREGFTEE